MRIIEVRTTNRSGVPRGVDNGWKTIDVSDLDAEAIDRAEDEYNRASMAKDRAGRKIESIRLDLLAKYV